MQTDEARFLAFIIAETRGFQAEADGLKDRRLQKFEKAGFVKHYDAMFGNNYYSLTEAGRAACMKG